MLRRGVLGGGAIALSPIPANAVPAHPDTALIALCAQIVDLEERAEQAYATIPDEDAAYLVAAPLWDRRTRLTRQTDLLQARTPMGILARAQALHAMNGDLDHSFDDPDTAVVAMLEQLLRDAAGLPPAEPD